MAIGIEKCPFCGGNILKGALKCTSCGKLLTTAEEQQEAITKHLDSNKKSGIKGLIVKIVIALTVIYLGFRFYDKILSLIDKI